MGNVGIVALQGAFRSHLEVFSRLGHKARLVRTPEDLHEVDALVIPGGESTTMSRLLEVSGLFDPMSRELHDGLPVFGTCAGMILLANEIIDGKNDQVSFGVIDISVRRNAFGTQVESFEAPLNISDWSETFPSVFIRAPVVEKVGDEVEVLAEINERPVLCRQGNVLTAAFHPELSEDIRIHKFFLEEICSG